MISIIGVISILAIAAIASVASAPIIFNKHLLDHGHDHISIINHVHFAHDHGFKLNFLLLIPKLGASLHEGFATGNGLIPLGDIKIEDGEHLHELLAISNCKTWFAIALKIFDAHANFIGHKFIAATINIPTGLWKKEIFTEIPIFTFFFKHFIDKGIFKKFIDAGLPSHELIHLIHHRLSSHELTHHINHGLL